MSKTTTILVATDFSKGAEKAASTARSLAQLIGKSARIHVTNIIDPLSPSPTRDGMIIPSQQTPADHKRQLAEFIEHFFDDDNAQWDVEGAVVKHTSYPQGIIEEAKRIGANVIVIATNGRKGIKHVLLGSVAEKVVQLSPIPVLTVNGNS